MSDEEEGPSPPESPGTPAWVMTFADLMSLLMCFFVLLLSFSQMDVLKFKQVAGSMERAFGVQREIKVTEPPKGTSIIAREFSPGRPDLTIIREIRQKTINENLQTLEFDPKTQLERMPEDKIKQEEHVQPGGNPELQEQINLAEESKKDSDKDDKKEGKDEKDKGKEIGEKTAQFENSNVRQKEKVEVAAADSPSQVQQQEENVKKAQKDQGEDKNSDSEITKGYAKRVSAALSDEIADEMITVETSGRKITIRILDEGIFSSGDDDFDERFVPTLDKIRRVILNTPGSITVSGHTDDLPISSKRYKSNWALSAARAVAVLDELLHGADNVPAERFRVAGYSSTRPLSPNTSDKNRRKNRRVEIEILQGESTFDQSVISVDEE